MGTMFGEGVDLNIVGSSRLVKAIPAESHGSMCLAGA